MADDSKTTSKLKLTRGAVALAESCLSQPGWAKDPRTIYRAGVILEAMDGDFGSDRPPAEPELSEEMPVAEIRSLRADYDAAYQVWATRAVEWQLSDKERDVVKAAVKHQVEQGGIRPTIHFCRLAEKLGLIED